MLRSFVFAIVGIGFGLFAGAVIYNVAGRGSEPPFATLTTLGLGFGAVIGSIIGATGAILSVINRSAPVH
jgi:hypothetical protein